jgi:hypothetical protein
MASAASSTLEMQQIFTRGVEIAFMEGFGTGLQIIRRKEPRYS